MLGYRCKKGATLGGNSVFGNTENIEKLVVDFKHLCEEVDNCKPNSVDTESTSMEINNLSKCRCGMQYYSLDV